MGVFRFTCPKCDREWSKILRESRTASCPYCKVDGVRIYNPPNTPVVYEIRDTYRGVRMRQDLMRQLVKRSHEHTLTHNIDEIVERNGIDAAKKAGYLDEKGAKKKVIDEK